MKLILENEKVSMYLKKVYSVSTRPEGPGLNLFILFIVFTEARETSVVMKNKILNAIDE